MRLYAAVLVMAAAAPAWAQAPDKNAYSLFDPTPDALLRDFSTDRPGKAHSPITLDAGHVQLESDIWNYTTDHWSPDGSTTRQTMWGVPNLKLGLTNWAEFDAILPLHTTLTERDRTSGQVTRASGLGDLQLGSKVNLLGNDGGDQSFGAIALVKLPTAARGLGNNKVEATLSLPFVTKLPADFSLTLETDLGLMRENTKPGYAGDLQFLANVSHPVIADSVTASLELAIDHSADHGTGTRDSVDPALQWLVTKTLQLDAGIYIGITKAAPDLNPYVGLAKRF